MSRAHSIKQPTQGERVWELINLTSRSCQSMVIKKKKKQLLLNNWISAGAVLLAFSSARILRISLLRRGVKDCDGVTTVPNAEYVHCLSQPQ